VDQLAVPEYAQEAGQPSQDAENLGLAWGVGISRHFADRFDSEAQLQTTAYERMWESPIMAVHGLLRLYVSKRLNDRKECCASNSTDSHKVCTAESQPLHTRQDLAIVFAVCIAALS